MRAPGGDERIEKRAPDTEALTPMQVRILELLFERFPESQRFMRPEALAGGVDASQHLPPPIPPEDAKSVAELRGHPDFRKALTDLEVRGFTTGDNATMHEQVQITPLGMTKLGLVRPGASIGDLAELNRWRTQAAAQITEIKNDAQRTQNDLRQQVEQLKRQVTGFERRIYSQMLPLFGVFAAIVAIIVSAAQTVQAVRAADTTAVVVQTLLTLVVTSLLIIALLAVTSYYARRDV